MARFLIIRLEQFLSRLEIALPQLFGHGGYPSAPAVIVNNHQPRSGYTPASAQLTLKDLIGDGFLWAVPKHRRSVEKRLKRKFGHPDYVWKPLKVKTHLKICHECGNDHEVGILCPACYEKARKETKLMQDKIQEKLGLDPVDKEVVVLYDGEHLNQSKESLEGKCVVEMEKPRPMWFSRNLLQKSVQQSPEPSEVKPSNLG